MLAKLVTGTLLVAVRIRIAFSRALFGIDRVSDIVARLPPRYIARVLRSYGASVGEAVNFKSGIQIDNAGGDRDSTGDFSNLRIGSRCYVGKGVFFDLPDRITLEDEVVISAGAKILTHADCGNRKMSQWYSRRRAPVRLGSGTWVGADAVILAGVELGKCCVVAAGAVVTEAFPDYSLVAGVPARLIHTLNDHTAHSETVLSNAELVEPE